MSKHIRPIPTIRPIGEDDVDWLLALNNASVPHVNALNREDLVGLLDAAAYARLILLDGVPSGALIAFWPGLDYGSANYQWFCRQFDRFLYVDRVMIHGDARGGGLGRALYADLDHFARTHEAPRIALEVNSRPPNPGSQAFHRREGFVPVGALDHNGGAKQVVLMIKPVEGVGPPTGRQPLPA